GSGSRPSPRAGRPARRGRRPPPRGVRASFPIPTSRLDERLARAYPFSGFPLNSLAEVTMNRLALLPGFAWIPGLGLVTTPSCHDLLSPQPPYLSLNRLSSMWPNADRQFWKFDDTYRQWDNPVVFSPTTDIPSPTFTQIETLLGNHPIGDNATTT